MKGVLDILSLNTRKKVNQNGRLTEITTKVELNKLDTKLTARFISLNI